MQSLKATAILAGSLLLGVVTTILTYKSSGAGLNVFVIESIFLAITAGVAFDLRGKIPKEAIVSGIFAALFSLTVMIWTSSVSMTLVALGLGISNMLLVLSIMGDSLRADHPFEFVPRILSKIERSFLSLEVFGSIKLPKLRRIGNARFWKAALLSMPVLMIFAILFISSDVVIINALENIDLSFKADGLGTVLEYVVLSLVLSAVFIVILGGMFWKKPQEEPASNREAVLKYESGVMLALTNILFGAFILFQSYYLFAGQKAWEKIEGITYAEYAHSGFLELSAVALLVIALVITVRYFHKESKDWRMRLLETLLPLQAFILMISAWIRLSIYVEQYGFTSLRLFAFWYFATIGLLLLLFAVYNALQKAQWSYMLHGLVLSGVSVLVFTALAPDSLAIKMQMNRAEEMGELIDLNDYLGGSMEAHRLIIDLIENHPELITPERPKLEINAQSSAKEIALCPTQIDTSYYRDGERITSYRFTHNLEIDDLITNYARALSVEGKYYNHLHQLQWRYSGGKGPAINKNWNDWKSWNLQRSRVPQIDEDSEYLKGTTSGEIRKEVKFDIEKACGFHFTDKEVS